MRNRGRIQDGLATPYDFSIVDMLKESWDGIHGFKATVWGALGYVMLVFLVASLILLPISSLAISAGASQEFMQSTR